MSSSTLFKDLQTALSAFSQLSTDPKVEPHHPITCSSTLRYEEDGSFNCPHAEVTADNPRLVAVLNHSIAILILEQAMAL